MSATSAIAEKPRKVQEGQTSCRLWLAALLSIPFLVPYHWLPSTGFYSSWTALMIGVGWAVFVSWRGLGRSGGTAPSVPLVAWTAVAFVGVLIGQQLLGKIVFFQTFLASTAALLVAFAVCTSGWRSNRDGPYRNVDVVACTIVVVAGIQAVWGMVQLSGYDLVGWSLLGRPNGAGYVQVSGLVAQPNVLAVLFVWALFSVIYLHARKQWSTGAAIAVSLAILVTLALVASRSTYVYLFILGPAFAFALRRLGTYREWWWPAIAPILYLIIELAVRASLEMILDSGLVLREMQLKTTSIRLQLFREALSIFINDPILGAGWGNFAGARFYLPTPPVVEVNADHAHNLLSHLLAESGLVGALVVAIGITAWGVRIFKSKMTLSTTLLLFLIAVIAIYSLLEFPLWLPFFLLPTAWMMGALETKASSHHLSRGFTSIIAVSLLMLAIGIGVVFPDYLRVERAYRQFFSDPEFTRPSAAELLELSSHTLFRLEMEQLYLRAAPLDPFMSMIDSPMSKRICKATPAPEFIAIHLNHLRLLGLDEDASALLDRACIAWPGYCWMFRSEFPRGAAGTSVPVV